MCEVKRNRRSTKSLSSFLAFLYIAIKHTGLAIHREHSKQSMIMHLSDSHVRGNIYFTTKDKSCESVYERKTTDGVTTT